MENGMNKRQRAAELLLKIEAELKRLTMWEAKTPPYKALQSQQPFCCDTLAFPQWLQFVFLPKMKMMIESGAALPENIAVCPMAEESLKQHKQVVVPLINLIADLDELLSGKRLQTIGRQA